MGVFSQSIPDVPENLKKSDYAITFNSNSSVYCLYSGIKTVTLKDEFDCFSANYGYYQCLSGSSSWTYVSSGGIGATASYPVCRSDIVSIVYSTYDIMSDSGKVYHYSGYSSNQNVICSTLSHQLYFLFHLLLLLFQYRIFC